MHTGKYDISGRRELNAIVLLLSDLPKGYLFLKNNLKMYQPYHTKLYYLQLVFEPFLG